VGLRGSSQCYPVCGRKGGPRWRRKEKNSRGRLKGGKGGKDVHGGTKKKKGKKPARAGKRVRIGHDLRADGKKRGAAIRKKRPKLRQGHSSRAVSGI